MTLAAVAAACVFPGAALAQAKKKAPSTSAAPAPVEQPQPPPAPPPPSPELEDARARVTVLEEAMKREQAELAALREDLARRLAAEQTERKAGDERVAGELAEQARRAAEAPPTVGATRFGLTLSGFAQMDFAARQSSEDEINPSSGEPLNETRFLLRRARLRAALDRTYVAGALEMDFNTVRGPQARPVNMEASLKWPGAAGSDVPLVMGTIGLFKIPFGFEVVQSDRDRLFMERSTVMRALFPGEYDLGARLQGGWLFVRYTVAVQNGDPLGERSFPGRDPNAAKDVNGRVGVDGMLGETVGVAAGFSGVYGKGLSKGTGATKPTFQWSDRNENGRLDGGELLVSPGTAAIASQDFKRHALGADARLRLRLPGVGETMAYGEMVWAQNLDRGVLVADPIAMSRDLRELGYYVALIQDVGPWLQVGARYDYYDPDRDSSDRQMAQLVPSSFAYRTLSVALALRGPNGRLILQYDANRNHLGRDAAGVPTNMADNAFTLRGEARF